MGLYHDHLLPWLIDATMRSGVLAPYRRRTVVAAAGRILEIGIGSGHNLAFYSGDVADIVGVDVSEALLAKASARAAKGRWRVRLVRADAADLPFAGASFDAAMLTWTLCSLPDPAAALAEIRRVLKRGGTLHYVEHGRAAGYAPGPRFVAYFYTGRATAER